MDALTSRRQGDLGELSAMQWLGEQGYALYLPLGHSPDCDLIDYLFVLVGDGRCWFIPANNVAGGTGILLGGPKYADFEVDPGQPLPLRYPA